ncbi:hypothetical protein D3C76_1350950 [compost metagenome]
MFHIREGSRFRLRPDTQAADHDGCEFRPADLLVRAKAVYPRIFVNQAGAQIIHSLFRPVVLHISEGCRVPDHHIGAIGQAADPGVILSISIADLGRNVTDRPIGFDDKTCVRLVGVCLV